VLIAVTTVSSQPAPFPTPKPYHPPVDAGFRDLPVSIVRGDCGVPSKSFNITGTLNVPDDLAPQARRAGVLFISGSGSQDRNGFSGPLDLGSWELLDAVANAGFVVLRTDDRGVGGTPVGPEGVQAIDIGYSALISDARFALEFLRNHPQVDSSQVFIIGHSEGSETARILAVEFQDTAGVVNWSGTGYTLVDTVNRQVLESLVKAKVGGKVIEATMKIQYEIMNATKDGRDPDFKIVPKARWEQLATTRKYFHEHANIPIHEITSQVSCPILIVNGAEDFQVSSEIDAPRIRSDVESGGSGRDVSFKIYPGLDHLMKSCGDKPCSLARYYEDRRVDPGFINDVVSWLQSKARFFTETE